MDISFSPNALANHGEKGTARASYRISWTIRVDSYFHFHSFPLAMHFWNYRIFKRSG